MHSKSSKPCTSLVFVETRFENISRIVSIWLFCAMSDDPRGMIDDRRRTRAGTLPFETHRPGVSIGGTRDL